MFRLIELGLGLLAAVAIMLNASVAEIAAIVAAAWLIAGIIYIVALDRLVKKWAGVKRWPTGYEIEQKKRQGLKGIPKGS